MLFRDVNLACNLRANCKETKTKAGENAQRIRSWVLPFGLDTKSLIESQEPVTLLGFPPLLEDFETNNLLSRNISTPVKRTLTKSVKSLSKNALQTALASCIPLEAISSVDDSESESEPRNAVAVDSQVKEGDG